MVDPFWMSFVVIVLVRRRLDTIDYYEFTEPKDNGHTVVDVQQVI